MVQGCDRFSDECMLSAAFIESAVYAMSTFTGMASAAFMENGVDAMII